MTIIDTHCHVISPDRDAYPLAPLGGKQSTWSEERPTTPDQLIAAMDDAGVEKSVVVQASTAYGHDSSYVVEAIRQYPDRLTGVFSIDPLAPDAMNAIDKWTSLGLTGMRVFTTGTTMPGQQTWLDDEAAYPTWAAAGERGLPIFVQMTLKGVPLLMKIVQAFPETLFLLDHLGRVTLDDGPPYDAAGPLLDFAPYSNVYLKFTSRTVEQCHLGQASAESFMPFVLEHFGAERIMWGSNFPAHDDTLENILREAQEVFRHADESDRKKILGGTAQRIYPALA